MEDCCSKTNLTDFKREINQILGRLYSQYYNITFLSFIDFDGSVIDFQIHSQMWKESKKKIDEILKKTLDFKLSSIKTAKLIGYESSSQTFIRGDSHVIVTYDIEGYLLIIYIEMSKPLIDAFDFEKFNEKIELILIELKKKIDSLKQNNENNK